MITFWYLICGHKLLPNCSGTPPIPHLCSLFPLWPSIMHSLKTIHMKSPKITSRHSVLDLRLIALHSTVQAI